MKKRVLFAVATAILLAIMLPLQACLADSPENENSTRGFVYRMYRIVLNREPDAAGLDYWVNKLESGEMGAADIVSGFFNSAEYTNQRKTSDQIVTDCYRAMLNRDPDAGGKEYWTEHLDVGMSSDAVCVGFLGSQEFSDLAGSYGIRPGTIELTKARDRNYLRTSFIYRLYKECLERTPDVNGLEYWCGQIDGGMGGTEIAYGFIFSDEYKNRLPDNNSYIEMLYRTILGRVSDKSGRQYWVDRLNNTITRESAMNGFMNSAEFSDMCRKAELPIGGSVPEPDGSIAWQANIRVLSLVNAERAAQGLQLLATREDFWEKVAMVRAEEVREEFSHTRPDGSDWDTAYDEGGFDWYSAGENIAYGYETPEEVVDAWMNSTGHRANILNGDFEILATGFATGYHWSQNFLEPW